MYGLSLVAAPSSEPLTLNEAKLHLRLDTSPISDHPDDLLISRLISAARRWAEGFQNRAFISQTWCFSIDRFPEERYIELPKAPLQSLVSMEYFDGAWHAIAFVDPSGTILYETDDYIVDVRRDPGRLCLKHGKRWPCVTRQANAIRISFIAGYGGAAEVPDNVKVAILLKMTNLYENRGDSDSGDAHEFAAKSLLWTDRDVPV
jgi:uncharacterized phiE125 gp8 family phage protein